MLKKVVQRTMHNLGESMIDRLSNEIAQFLAAAIKDPLNEISGHFTHSALKKWITTHSRDVDAVACAVHYNRKSQVVVACLLDAESGFLYSPDGCRLMTSFRARTMDEHIAELFVGDELIIITLKE